MSQPGQPGYQPGSEPVYWWKVAMHLDEASIALANAMAHNLDDQSSVFVLQDKLREAQALLLEIFRAKGLLPESTNGASPLAPDEPAVPEPDHVVEVATGVPVASVDLEATATPEPEVPAPVLVTPPDPEVPVSAPAAVDPSSTV